MNKKSVPNLIVEYLTDTTNNFYLSVLEYRGEKMLVVIDNITQESVGAYVLDLARQEGLDTQQLLRVVTDWFYRSSGKYPLSFEFSRLGLSGLTNKIYRQFDTNCVTRLVGNDFTYRLNSAPRIKRRRVTKLPAGIEVRLSRGTLKMSR